LFKFLSGKYENYTMLICKEKSEQKNAAQMKRIRLSLRCNGVSSGEKELLGG
jgi:hypothetical protein